MNFTITSNFHKGDIFLNTIKLMSQIGEMMLRNIIARTQHELVDYERKKFKRYSKGYAAYKDRHGGSGSIVNLKSVIKTGSQMVASVKVQKVKKNYVEVGVSGDNLEKAMYNEKMGRVFLGVSKKDSKDINKIIDVYIEKELNKL